MNINFFWTGDNFTFINRISVLSNIFIENHKPIMWLHGETPKSKYWIADKEIEIRDAREILDITPFLKNGGNYRTASDLWSFKFLYDTGEYYTDTDMFSLNNWPEENKVLASANEEGHLAISVMKLPPKQEFLLECIEKIKYDWGNVALFTDIYRKHFGEIKNTHDNWKFFPYSWRNWKNVFKNTLLHKDTYGVHLYGFMFERNKIKIDENYNDENSLLYKLIKFSETGKKLWEK